MTKRFFLLSLILLLSFGLLIGNVHARGGLYKIEPHGKHIETIRLSVSDKISGNFSVIEGTVDFYVISPNRVIVLNYTHLPFSVFSFCALEDGNYTICLVNSSNTTATIQLFYSGDFKRTLVATLTFSDAVKIKVISSFSWMKILEHIVHFLLVVLSHKIADLIKGLVDLMKWVMWRRKYGRPRTPIVIERKYFG